jgi:hypothetical protein
MIAGEPKSRIDRIRDAMRAGGWTERAARRQLAKKIASAYRDLLDFGRIAA